MINKYSRFIMVLMLFLFAQLAQAYIDPPILSPSQPIAGQQISVLIRAGYCDGFFGSVDSAIVTQSGNNIRMLIDSIHGDDTFCIFPPEFTYRFVVGIFPAENYTLQVDRRYTPLVGPDVVETLGILPVAVLRVPLATSIPVTSCVSLFALVIALVLSVTVVIELRGKVYRERAHKSSAIRGFAQRCRGPILPALVPRTPTRKAIFLFIT